MVTPTTVRQDLAAGLLAIIDSFIAANPTLLRRSYPVQPPGFVEFPSAYVGPRTENATHSAGTRTRTLSPSIVLVDRIGDNTETMGRMDILVDAFADHLTAHPHVVANTIWEDWTVVDEQIDIGDGSALLASTFTLSDLSAKEGRT